MKHDTQEDKLSYAVIGAAIEVHRTLGGPGLLEIVYEETLTWELEQRGFEVQRQVAQPIEYKGRLLGHPLRIDMIINDLVILECKALSQYNPIFETQLLTYLRLRDLRLGIVINFGETILKNGIHRAVNNL